MEKILFNVRALAAISGMSIEELAKKANISVNHLKNVSCGRVAMTIRDQINLSEVTGIPKEQIKFE